MKKLLIILIIFIIYFITPVSFAEREVFTLDVSKNAARHNNLGLIRLEDGYYDMAISEFQLAIDLCPNSKATAIYYNNMGDAYMKMGHYGLAQNAYENAIKISPLTFLYYQNVVKCYKSQGVLKTKIAQYQSLESSNALYMVMLGLCYIENGEMKRGIIKLDEFCMQEPYLLTTFAVKNYLKELTENYY